MGKKKRAFLLSFENGDEYSRGKNGRFRLFRNGVELTAGVRASDIYSYMCGGWYYQDFETRFYHLFKNGIDMTKGLNAVYVELFADGCWDYADEENNRYYFDANNNEILSKRA